MREYAESGKKKISDRKSHLKRKYGLTLEEFDAHARAQGGGVRSAASPTGDHVDHDHATGAIRGILCFPATSRSVTSRRRGRLLQAAADYLDRDDELTALARERALALTRLSRRR